MGFAKEKRGRVGIRDTLLRWLSGHGSRERLVIALTKLARQPIQRSGAQNADKSRKELSKNQDMQARVARLNTARRFRHESERRNKRHAIISKQRTSLIRQFFAITNMGYLAELEGDRGTRNFL